MRAAPDAQILDALRLMQLQLPVSPTEITQQYRKLALLWHPDRNVSDPSATERMQGLNSAMELLTGVNLSDLTGTEIDAVRYERILHRESSCTRVGERMVGIEAMVVLGGSEASAADWIYAADYSVLGDRVYIAGYSGKVVVLSRDGQPERVYDIGAVPRRIYDTGPHLYLVTDTRLYVINGDRLECLIEVSDGAQVVPTETGFALLRDNVLEWHSPEGRRMGALHARHPIRRAYHDGRSLRVETRQHRAVVTGAQRWW
jgi:hypothetical protein